MREVARGVASGAGARAESAGRAALSAPRWSPAGAPSRGRPRRPRDARTDGVAEFLPALSGMSESACRIPVRAAEQVPGPAFASAVALVSALSSMSESACPTPPGGAARAPACRATSGAPTVPHGEGRPARDAGGRGPWLARRRPDARFAGAVGPSRATDRGVPATLGAEHVPREGPDERGTPGRPPRRRRCHPPRAARPRQRSARAARSTCVAPRGARPPRTRASTRASRPREPSARAGIHAPNGPHD